MQNTHCAWCQQPFLPQEERKELDHKLFHSGKPHRFPEVQTCLEAFVQYCQEIKRRG